MTVIITIALGAGAGLGLWLIAAGWRGTRLLPDRRLRIPNTDTRSHEMAWLAAAVLSGVILYAVTGWPVAGLITAGSVMWLPWTLAARAKRVDHTIRTEAIATWTEMIRDNIAGSAGLEQALIASASVAPEAIGSELRRFAARLDRMPTVSALTNLGTDLNHPSADLVVVALVNAARMEARELGPLLSRLAETIRADVRMRQRVEVGRARIRTSARIVVATTVVTIGFLFVFSRQLLAAYNSVTGQLWLVVVAAVFALGGWILHRYGQIDMPERFAARSQHEVAL